MRSVTEAEFLDIGFVALTVTEFHNALMRATH